MYIRLYKIKKWRESKIDSVYFRTLSLKRTDHLIKNSFVKHIKKSFKTSSIFQLSLIYGKDNSEVSLHSMHKTRMMSKKKKSKFRGNMPIVIEVQ